MSVATCSVESSHKNAEACGSNATTTVYFPCPAPPSSKPPSANNSPQVKRRSKSKRKRDKYKDKARMRRRTRSCPVLDPPMTSANSVGLQSMHSFVSDKSRDGADNHQLSRETTKFPAVGKPPSGRPSYKVHMPGHNGPHSASSTSTVQTQDALSPYQPSHNALPPSSPTHNAFVSVSPSHSPLPPCSSSQCPLAASSPSHVGGHLSSPSQILPTVSGSQSETSPCSLDVPNSELTSAVMSGSMESSAADVSNRRSSASGSTSHKHYHSPILYRRSSSKKVHLLVAIKPDNQDVERGRFFRFNFHYNPQFEYKHISEPKTMRKYSRASDKLVPLVSIYNIYICIFICVKIKLNVFTGFNLFLTC